MTTFGDFVSRPGDLSALWEPLTLGGVTVPNRLALSPITTMWTVDGVMTETHLAHYEERARGGVGLLISEEHTADRERTGFSRHVPSALDERSVPVFEALAERVHRHGAVQFVQLYGPGILDQVTIDVNGWTPPLSPSGIPSAGFGEVPVAMSQAQLAGVVRSFARAAANVARGGLDGVELHSARSELLGQFLSPLYNRRTDAYGGDALRRCLLATQVAQAVREAAPGLAVGIQISLEEYMGPAALTQDQAAEQLAFLTADGLFDYVNVSTGNEFTDDVTIPPMESHEIPTEAFAARAKKIVPERTKILINGGVHDLATAARLVREGAADLISMSRATIADPELARKAQAGRTAEIRPCLGHNDCLRSVMGQRPMTCLMNPIVGRELTWGPVLTPPARRAVVVVGGGPAGLRAALTAAEAGHTVTLFEREAALGGHLRPLAGLPHRRRWQDAIDWYTRELTRLGVTVHTGVLAGVQTPELLAADVVLVATGARWQSNGFTPFRPDRTAAPGTDQDHVIDVGTAIERTTGDPLALGERVVVVDDSGDYAAAGLIDRLSAAGVAVDVVTKNPGMAARVFGGLDHAELYKRLSAQGVRLHAGRFLDAVEGTDVHSIEMWSGRRTTVSGADTVVLAMGRASDAGLATALAGLRGDVRVVGDALAPRETRIVVAEAHAIARSL